MIIGLSQFLDLARREKSFIENLVKSERSAADTDIIRLKLAGIGQIALQHVTITDEVASIIKHKSIACPGDPEASFR